MLHAAVAQAAPPPAGGATLAEVLVGSAVGATAIALVVAVGIAHRRRGLLGPLVRLVEGWTGLPGWSGLPMGIAGAGLVTAVFGYYWDVSWHIDRGRDAGPYANPAHWFIIVGLDLIVFAALLSLVLGDRRTATSVELRPGWHVPVGGLALSACGLVALAGFPLDDVWHRLFGQDVTAWGPTHIQMIGGASISTLALWVLMSEGVAAGDPERLARWAGLRRLADVALGGAFLLGLSTLQVEFDFGVPQFRQLFHPTLLALGAGIGLVAARIRIGAGGALGAVLFFLAVRGGLALAIGPLLGRDIPHFPLYVAEALAVEAVAFLVPRGRQLTLGALSGLAIGTVGLAAEWAWSHAWMPIPWRAALLPEAALLAPLAGVAGGVIGGLIGRAVAPAGPGAARQRSPAGVVPLAWLGAVICLALPLPLSDNPDWQADISLSPAPGDGGGERTAFVNAELGPGAAVGAADGAEYFHVLAWQGRPDGEGGLVLSPMRRTGERTWRSDRPVPLDGTWKTVLRLHAGDSLQAVPLYLPADPAIPAAAVEPSEGVRPFQRDKVILQREARTDRAALQQAANVLLALVAAAWMLALAWSLRRLATAPDPTPHRPLSPTP